MLEIKIVIESKDLTGAINNLAQAITNGKGVPALVPASVIEASAGVAPAPVAPAPAAPASVAPAPAAPAPAAPAYVAPAPAAPAPVAPAPAAPAPVATQPQITLTMLSNAGAALLDAEKTEAVVAAVQKYGVDSIMNLKVEDYPSLRKISEPLAHRSNGGTRWLNILY